MLPAMTGYAIRGGAHGYDRLLLLADDRRSDTLDLLRRAGVGLGQRCLDVGCGGGEVCFDLATLVGPTGRVTGVDLDEVKLKLARVAAAQRGLDYVDFVAGDVTGWPTDRQFDVVYSRFVLHHLADPISLLRRMWAAVAPGGRLIVEDADFDGNFADPPCPAAEEFTRLYIALLAARGSDATVGRKLYRFFAAAGIPTPQLSVVSTVNATGDRKRLRLLTFQATADNMVAEGLTTAGAAAAAINDLAKFIGDPTTILGGPRVFQLWVARP